MIRVQRWRVLPLSRYHLSCRNISSSSSLANVEINTTFGNEHKDPTRAESRVKYQPVKTVFSGIQPTGVPHLGNYLGALRQWKQFQDEKTDRKQPRNYRLIFSVVDLHALTHQQRPDELFQRRKETLASLLTIGLDPRHSAMFYQSSVPGHTQLMWYLSTIASTGYLSRMTQWKSKLGVSENATIDDKAAREKLRLGLFSYPVLQAADILLYRTDLVPVGEDQQQHVEFARSLANSFNAQFMAANEGQPFFKLPKALISPAKRIMSLRDPTVKMSKSHPDANSRILITDSADTIRTKMKGALTDSIEGISYNPQTRPGVSNLVDILKHVKGDEVTSEEIASDNANVSMRAFKEHVANEIIHALQGFRDRFMELMDPKNDEVTEALATGRRVAKSRAGHHIEKIDQLIGLHTPRVNSTAKISEAESTKSKEANRQAIQREQEEEELLDEHEPDVVPQQHQGVDRPIAS